MFKHKIIYIVIANKWKAVVSLCYLLTVSHIFLCFLNQKNEFKKKTKKEIKKYLKRNYKNSKKKIKKLN